MVSEHSERPLVEVVDRLYAALRAGDDAALLDLLHPSFVARFAEGMPVGGGRTEGPEAARDRWWAIGRAYALAPEVEERIPCADGRLVVRGRYRGTARDDGHVVDAAFVHVFAVGDDGRLVALEQVTDTVRWRPAGRG